MGTEIEPFTIVLNYRPDAEVAYLKCMAALANLEWYELDRVLVRVAVESMERSDGPRG